MDTNETAPTHRTPPETIGSASRTAPFGVLLTNLGTPDAPTTKAVRKYLAEFLWDVRVVDAPRWLWWLILHGVILRIRPRRSAALYQRVWSESGSPLLAISEEQRAGLEQTLAADGGEAVPVVLGMRYGNPSIAAGIEALQAAGVQRILVLPAYPQYAASTTASTFDAVGHALRDIRHIPEVRFVAGYHDEPAYISALANSIRGRLAPDAKLLLSFHGIPVRYVNLGDPYRAQCEATADALAKALGLTPDQWALSFQSRVGREEWLKPYTDDLLEQWAEDGVTHVQVACPGFSADCLETVDEIARESREAFEEAGGTTFEYLPALNASEDHLAALAGLVRRHSAGWSKS